MTRPRGVSASSSYEIQLRALAGERGIAVAFEHRFHPTRRWRFDAAFPDRRIAIEIDGAVWAGGRHTRGKGFISDMEKLNAAAMLGWAVYRFTPDQVESGVMMETVNCALDGGSPE